MPDPADEPLIYTTKGNLPVASLVHKPGWQVGPDEVVFYEEYYLDGEMVKRSAHVMKLRGDAVAPQQATI